MVKSGLEEGGYYMRQQGYRSQFIKKLGMNPYRGTLNLNLSERNAKILAAIKERKGILINGFGRGD